MSELRKFQRSLLRSYGAWPLLDDIAHRIHVRGPIGRWLCYRADLAFGMTKEEARS